MYRAFAILFGLTFAFSGHAQTYPSGPVRFVVPFTPGTGMDTIARTVGARMSERLKVPVVVENKPGASGNIGTAEVARARADGQTVLVSANTLLIAALLYKSVPYDPLADFAPISLAAWGTLLMASHPGAGIGSVEELIRNAKTNPGKLHYSSPGIGTPHHMAMELFKDRSGANLVHVPYKGSAGALADLLSGQVSVGFVPIHVAIPHVRAGRLKPLAVGSPQRHPATPELPTLQDAGVRGAEVDMWYAFLGPKGTPAPVLAKLNAEIGDILALAEVRVSFERQGLQAAPSSPAALRALMHEDHVRWAEVIRRNQITAE